MTDRGYPYDMDSLKHNRMATLEVVVFDPEDIAFAWFFFLDGG